MRKNQQPYNYTHYALSAKMFNILPFAQNVEKIGCVASTTRNVHVLYASSALISFWQI